MNRQKLLPDLGGAATVMHLVRIEQLRRVKPEWVALAFLHVPDSGRLRTSCQVLRRLLRVRVGKWKRPRRHHSCRFLAGSARAAEEFGNLANLLHARLLADLDYGSRAGVVVNVRTKLRRRELLARLPLSGNHQVRIGAAYVLRMTSDHQAGDQQ